MKRKMKYKIRYWMIEKLVKNMPIVMNVNVVRPTGYTGAMVGFPRPDLPGIFSNNSLYNKADKVRFVSVDAIITPRRDVIIEDLPNEKNDPILSE